MKDSVDYLVNHLENLKNMIVENHLGSNLKLESGEPLGYELSLVLC